MDWAEHWDGWRFTGCICIALFFPLFISITLFFTI